LIGAVKLREKDPRNKFEALSSNEKIELIYTLLKDVLKEANLEHDIEAASKGDVNLPVYIFQNDNLSCLESIVKYMHENLDFGFTKIAKILNRSSKTIWATYSKAHSKMPEKFKAEVSTYYIPVGILSERIVSVLESLVEFLREKHDLSYKQISVLLNRDNRTIWTVYQRAKQKRVKR